MSFGKQLGLGRALWLTQESGADLLNIRPQQTPVGRLCAQARTPFTRAAPTATAKWSARGPPTGARLAAQNPPSIAAGFPHLPPLPAKTSSPRQGLGLGGIALGNIEIADEQGGQVRGELQEVGGDHPARLPADDAAPAVKAGVGEEKPFSRARLAEAHPGADACDGCGGIPAERLSRRAARRPRLEISRRLPGGVGALGRMTARQGEFRSRFGRG